MKFFLDSDVILDLLLEREGIDPAREIFETFEQRKSIGFTSPVIISNVYYIAGKQSTLIQARKAITTLLKTPLTILEMNHSIVTKALKSNISDFEDAMQYYTATHHHCEVLVTRNTKDYPKSNRKIKILTPAEALAL